MVIIWGNFLESWFAVTDVGSWGVLTSCGLFQAFVQVTFVIICKMKTFTIEKKILNSQLTSQCAKNNPEKRKKKQLICYPNILVHWPTCLYQSHQVPAIRACSYSRICPVVHTDSFFVAIVESQLALVQVCFQSKDTY